MKSYQLHMAPAAAKSRLIASEGHAETEAFAEVDAEVDEEEEEEDAEL